MAGTCRMGEPGLVWRGKFFEIYWFLSKCGRIECERSWVSKMRKRKRNAVRRIACVVRIECLGRYELCVGGSEADELPALFCGVSLQITETRA